MGEGNGGVATGLYTRDIWVCTHGTSQVESSDYRVERWGELVERLVGLMRREVRAMHWGWCRRAPRSSCVKRRHVKHNVFDLFHFGEGRERRGHW